jgi:hypothetical protein
MAAALRVTRLWRAEIVKLQHIDNGMVVEQITISMDNLRSTEEKWRLPFHERFDWLRDREPNLHGDEVRVTGPGHDDEVVQVHPSRDHGAESMVHRCAGMLETVSRTLHLNGLKSAPD